MNRWEHVARRIVLATATATGLLLVLGMVLSYAGLRAVCIGAGLPGWAASLAPLCVDLLALVGYVALLVLRSKAYPGLVVAVTVLGSAGAQGYHLSHGGVAADITDGRVIFAVGASSMVCAGMAGHLLWLILARALPPGFITAMQAEPAAAVYDQAEPARVPIGRREDDATAAVPIPTRALPPIPPPVTDPPGLAAVRQLHPEIALTADQPRPLAPARIHRPTATARVGVTRGARGGTSQEPGPCYETCTHHAGETVSKSTRYRCRPGGACTTCNPTEIP